MYPGPFQIVALLVVVVLVFGGRGRISSIMGDLAKGVRSFRDGLKDVEKEASKPMVDVTPEDEKEKNTSETEKSKSN